MFYKLYEQIVKIIKENYKFFLVFIITVMIFSIEFSYYIQAPGGIIDVRERIYIEDEYDSKGSLNMAYVSEYKATIPTLLIAKLNKDWNIIKKDSNNLNSTSKADYFRNKTLLEEANQNALIVAYSYTSLDVKLSNTKIYVTYVLEESDSEFQVGDQIIEVNGVKINNKNDLKNVISNLNIEDKFEVKVINDGKEYMRKVKLIKHNDSYILGVAISELSDITTIPEVKFNFNNSESGPSGGLMMALTIYDSITKEDITKGLKIVGTGTIDSDGNIGEIDGVEYKLKAAVKAQANLFLVPAGKNYKEAVRVKKDSNYDIDIVPINTFEEALEYLKSN